MAVLIASALLQVAAALMFIVRSHASPCGRYAEHGERSNPMRRRVRGRGKQDRREGRDGSTATARQPSG